MTLIWLRDPEPEDGELGYTAPLEGNRDADLDLEAPDEEPVPGQLELLEDCPDPHHNRRSYPCPTCRGSFLRGGA